MQQPNTKNKHILKKLLIALPLVITGVIFLKNNISPPINGDQRSSLSSQTKNNQLSPNPNSFTDKKKVETGAPTNKKDNNIVLFDSNTEIEPKHRKNEEKNPQNKKIEELVAPTSEAELLAALLSNAVLEKEISENKKTEKNENLINKEDFLHQEVDANWAAEEEYLYIDMFGEDESLADFALRSSECRNDTCKVVIASDNKDQKDNLTQAMANALLKKKSSFGITVPSDSSAEVEFYISDQGKESID